MKLRKKIMLLPIAAVCIVALLVTFGLLRQAANMYAVMEKHENDAAESALRQSLEQVQIDALVRADVLASMADVQAAVAAHDDKRLGAIMAQGFKELAAQTGIEQLQFHIPPATSLIRIHKLAAG